MQNQTLRNSFEDFCCRQHFPKSISNERFTIFGWIIDVSEGERAMKDWKSTKNRFYLSPTRTNLFTQSNLGFWHFHLIRFYAPPLICTLFLGTLHLHFNLLSIANVTALPLISSDKKKRNNDFISFLFIPAISPLLSFPINCLHRFYTREP